MPLLGSGVLAVWNNIAPCFEAEFVSWHVSEHIPERVAISGFLRGRRYIGTDANPKYFNFYETESVETLGSPAYHERLNAPTPWTKKVVAKFKDTSRTACSVATSVGLGTGAWIHTAQLRVRPEISRTHFLSGLDAVLTEISEASGVVGVHLLEGQRSQTKIDTAEKVLRGQPDEFADWIILTEAIDAKSASIVRETALDSEALYGIGAADDSIHGVYRFEFGLTKADLQAPHQRRG